MKQLSIIMPVYNAGNTIDKAINSVLEQKQDDIELLIIDGGSTDDTKEVVNKYKNQVDCFISEHDKGYADALNKGIKIATGKYVMMLAGDDYLIKNSLKSALSSMKADTDVWCGAIVEKMKYGYRIDKSYKDLNRLYYECSLRHPATIFRKKVLEICGGYDTSLKCAADRELFLRLYTMKAHFQVEEIPMVVFSMEGMSVKDPKQYAIPEDRLVSQKYGLTQEQIENNEQQITKTFQHIHNTEMCKILLSKIGLLPTICKIIGKPDSCLDRKALEKMDIR